MNNSRGANEIDLDCISPQSNVGYGCLPIPNARDSEISTMLDAWAAAPEAQRAMIASTMSQGNADVLLAYSERMASLAVRLNGEEPIVRGLLALCLAWGHTDDREVYCILPLHYNSSRIIQRDPKRIFEKATIKGVPECQQAMMGFLGRDEQDKSPEVMGYVESTDEEGFRYHRTW